MFMTMLLSDSFIGKIACFEFRWTKQARTWNQHTVVRIA